ncbi:MAG: response regulator [Anaerolineae bacterium]|nr:response regulator [Anaerolineae bacterium]
MMADLSHTQVLVADDEILVLESTRAVLDRLGYDVIGEAVDGLQAVAMTQELHPDIVLMDIEMPRMDGLEAARRIQDCCPTPIVILTAYDVPDLVRQAARETGIGAYLIKPVSPREVERSIIISRARFQDLMDLRKLNTELEQALATIKTLHGLIPICAWCGRKIQDEHGKWYDIEKYIESHSEASFTHGICPDCYSKMGGGNVKRDGRE